MENDDSNNNNLDNNTKRALENGFSRRNFLTGVGAGAASLGVMSMAGTATAADASAAAGDIGKSSDGGATLSFLPKPTPIADKDIGLTETYDVVVVGAGAAGVPAALSAAENGAKVAVLQKAPQAVSQGNTCSGPNVKGSDKAALEALVALVCARNAHRCSPALIRQWVYNSGEALEWVIDRAKKAGAQVENQGNAWHGDLLKINGLPLDWVTAQFGPKPYNTGDGMRQLAGAAEKAGVKFYYSTPAVQLVQNAAGDVVGVIGKGKDGKYVKLLAKKGVIVATGDYQNNKAMSDFFVPDLKYFGRKQTGRTGDGFTMIYWAGGVIEPIGHTKILHDFDAGPAPMCDMPFLVVDMDGKRFVNETVEMADMNNYLRGPKHTGEYCQIFDSNYMTQAAKWPGKLIPPEGLKNWMPDDPSPKKGVIEPMINTRMGNTLEELAKKLGIDPATFVASVKRYNEVVASGKDSDFGKPAEYLAPIEKGPFYGIHRHLRVTAVASGMVVDENHRALNAEGKVIKGLYAVGNLGGLFYGGVDYPMVVPGMSLGRCITFGYLAGRQVAKL